MGKRKFIDKKKAVMFKLVPAIDKNNQERVLIQYVETKNSKLSEKEKQQLRKGLSNENEFDMRKVEPPMDDRFAGIPPEILEKIRGRSDLMINQIGRGRGGKNNQDDEQSQEDIRIEEVDEEEGAEDAENADEEPDAELDEVEENGYLDSEEPDEWVDDEDEDDVDSENCDHIEDLGEVEKPSKPPVFDDADFPELPDTTTMTKQQLELLEQERSLTEQQRRLLDVVLPEDYKQMEFKGMKMKRFDEMGLPLDDGVDYSKYFSRGGGEVIASMYSELPPVTTPDIDYKESELPEEAKEVEDILNGGEGYQPLEDDFFIKLMQQEGAKVEIKKPVKRIAGNTREMQVKKPKKPVVTKQPEEAYEQVQEEKPKLPIEEAEYEDITDEQLDSALKDFDEHKEFSTKVKFDLSRNSKLQPPTPEKEEQEDEYIPFHELSKKEKLRFMRNHKITEPQDVQQEELEQKLNSVGHCIKPEEMHLRKVYPKIPLAEDICMQATLAKDSEESPIDQESSSDHDDIVSYRMKNSTICTNLNIVDDRKPKKVKDSNNNTIQDSSVLRAMPKPAREKRNRNETKQEKKERKERLKQFKKERKEVKKEFMEELNQQRRVVDGNATAPLYGISRIKIQ